jgi:hypothetical protein
VHFHVEVIRYHRDLLDELIDQHTSLDVRGGLPCLVDIESCEQLSDLFEVLGHIVVACHLDTGIVGLALCFTELLTEVNA